MILTCPACDTKYVVKDGAIPAGGRQVRCASCKHSWHQDPEPTPAEPETGGRIDFGGPPPPQPQVAEQPVTEAPVDVHTEGQIAAEPQPEVTQQEESPWGAVAEEPVAPPAPAAATGMPVAVEPAVEEAHPTAEEWHPPQATTEERSAEEEFVGYSPIDEDEERPRRIWPLILVILLVIVAAAAAFWFFAPAEWKTRAGLAQGGATPLQLTLESQDLQQLSSGNQLLTIRGRVINPTQEEQPVPPIRAQIRDDATGAVIHQWTIGAPTRVLAPGTSASFYSAGVDVPPGSEDELITVSIGG